jgi:hypothetical protein
MAMICFIRHQKQWHHHNRFAQYVQHRLLPVPADSAHRIHRDKLADRSRRFIIAGSSTDRPPRGVSLMVISIM